MRVGFHVEQSCFEDAPPVQTARFDTDKDVMDARAAGLRQKRVSGESVETTARDSAPATSR